MDTLIWYSLPINEGWDTENLSVPWFHRCGMEPTMKDRSRKANSKLAGKRFLL